MATYQVRGSSHNIIYLYRTDDGKSKQHWETYETELEAIQRKAYIELWLRCHAGVCKFSFVYIKRTTKAFSRCSCRP